MSEHLGVHPYPSYYYCTNLRRDHLYNMIGWMILKSYLYLMRYFHSFGNLLIFKLKVCPPTIKHTAQAQHLIWRSYQTSPFLRQPQSSALTSDVKETVLSTYYTHSVVHTVATFFFDDKKNHFDRLIEWSVLSKWAANGPSVKWYTRPFYCYPIMLASFMVTTGL